MSAQQPEQINLDPQKVISKLRDQVATLGWQNLLLETRAEMAEERCDELLKALSERSSTPPETAGEKAEEDQRPW